jgi:hypothetical protein
MIAAGFPPPGIGSNPYLDVKRAEAAAFFEL